MLLNHPERLLHTPPERFGRLQSFLWGVFIAHDVMHASRKEVIEELHTIVREIESMCEKKHGNRNWYKVLLEQSGGDAIKAFDSFIEIAKQVRNDLRKQSAS
jgi:hypothetical protein